MALDRRTFMKLGGAGILGVTFSSLLPGCEEHIVKPLGGLSEAPFLTPEDLFFVQNGGAGSIPSWQRPTLTEEGWEMTIEGFAAGDVTTEMTIRFSDLMAAANVGKEVTILKTIQCVLESPLRLTPTGFMGNAYWTGIPLKHFIDQAGLSPDVKRLLFYGADGFTNNITIERLNDAGSDGLAQPLLVYRMNGRPLTPDHGFPVRLIIQEGYGYKNVKWLDRVVATKFDVEFGTYQEESYVDDGVTRVNSRATSIREGVTLAAGDSEITGFAVSGYAPIEKVEVRIDGGAFQTAEIVPLDEIMQNEALPPAIAQIARNLPYPFHSVWAKWRFRWDAPRGSHVVEIRATDKAGNVQPEQDTNVFDGQTGVLKYNVTVN